MTTSNPFIVGEKCYLRGLAPADANATYAAWLNDYEVTKYLEVGRFPMTEADLLSFLEGRTNNHTGVLFAICDLKTDQHIGNVALNHIHPVHRRADFGILIGEKSFWGKGYGTEATRLIIDYGFRRLNLHSIWLGVLAANIPAKRSYEKIGFVVDGKNRQAWWADGQWHDVYQMSLLASEYYAAQKAETDHD